MSKRRNGRKRGRYIAPTYPPCEQCSGPQCRASDADDADIRPVETA